MAQPVALHAYSYADYLAVEEQSPVRHEFVSGEIYAMAGGTPEHAALAAAVLRVLGNALPAGRRAYSSDLRVRIAHADATTYPDASVVCGKVDRAADDPLAVTNPSLVVEVTSGSTETYDRGAKLSLYQSVSSVREVLLVSHLSPRLTLHARAADGTWSSVEAVSGGAVELVTLGARVEVDALYGDLLASG